MADESENLPLESIQRIDRLCDQYEEQWNVQQHSQLEKYLNQVPELEREALFRALLKVELELQNSEALEQLAQDLSERFPEYQSTITQLIETASKQLLPNSGSKVPPDSPTKARSVGEFEHPQKIERFEIQTVLGEGGFGTVYKAFDPNLNRTVALKIPLPSTLKSKENLDRFVREAQIAASLYHSGICPIYDVDQQGKLPFIVMKYIEGTTLDEILKRQYPNNRLMPIPKTVQLIQKIGEAIDYAHNKGIIHRDLKPSNIIWDKENKKPVITDFGLARFWNKNDSELTATGQTMGTPAFIAPEQALGKSQDLGRQVDVYSLGVIFYEILTGHRPFPGNSYDVVIQKNAEEPPPPSAHRVEIDAQLDAICLKAIARTPQQRYQSAQDLIDALKEYASTEDVSPPSRDIPSFSDDEPQLKPISQNPLEKKSTKAKQKPGKTKNTKQVEIDPDYDPYYLWLGIPKEYRPTTYYELLGVGNKEEDDQIIAAAAKRQTAIVQQYRATEYDHLARQLEYEISEAKTVLSDPYLRMEYRRTKFKTIRARYRGVGIPTGDPHAKPVGEGAEFLRSYLGIMSIIALLMILAFVVSAYAPIWGNKTDQNTEIVRNDEQEQNEEKQEEKVKEEPAQEEVAIKPADIDEEVMKKEDAHPKPPEIDEEGWMDLLAGFDLDRQTMHGRWNYEEHQLTSLQQDDFASAQFAFEETANYELETEFSFTDPPDNQSSPGILLSVPVGASRVWIEISHDWCILRGLSLNKNESGLNITEIGEDGKWRWSQNGKVVGTYIPDSQELGMGFAMDDWKINLPAEKHVKINLSVTASKDQYRLVFRLNDHFIFDRAASASQLRRNSGFDLWNGRTRHGLAIATGNARHPRGALFSVFRAKPGITDAEIPSPEPVKTAVPVQIAVKEQLTFKGHQHYVNCAVFTPDGKRLISGSSDKSIKIWDPDSGNEFFTVTENPKQKQNGISCVAIHPEGRFFASANGGWHSLNPVNQGDYTVSVWDLENRSQLFNLSGHTDRPISVAFSPQTAKLVTASLDNTVRVWDLETGKQEKVYREHQAAVLDAQFSPDGNYIVSTSRDPHKSIIKWEVDSGKEVFYISSEQEIRRIRFSTDGKSIIGGTNGKEPAPATVFVWDTDTGEIVNSFPTHQGRIRSVAVSPNGKWLATGSSDRTAKLWELKTGRELATLSGHTRKVQSVAFAPEGLRLATTSEDRTVKIWELKPFNPHSNSSAIAPTEPLIKLTAPIVLIPSEDLNNHFVPYYGLKAPKNQIPNKYKINEALNRKGNYLKVIKNLNGFMFSKEAYENYRLEIDYRWEKSNYSESTKFWGNFFWFNMELAQDQIPDDLTNYYVNDFEKQIISGFNVRVTPLSRKGVPFSINGKLEKSSANVNTLIDIKENSSSKVFPFHEKPPGSMNKLEIMSYHGDIEARLNGITTFKGKNAVPSAGRIGIETKNRTFTIRKMVIHPYNGPETEQE